MLVPILVLGWDALDTQLDCTGTRRLGADPLLRWSIWQKVVSLHLF